jgi:hypothetical protein
VLLLLLLLLFFPARTSFASRLTLRFSFVCSFPPPENSQWPASSAVHEFSCSPLSQFYLPIRTYRQEDNEDIAIK